MAEGEGAEETEREQEKLDLRGGRKAGPLSRGDSRCWRGCRGERQVQEGLRRLQRQECIRFRVRLGSGLGLASLSWP